MKCVIREQLARRNLSIRSFAEQFESDPDALSYSTIDNFIRKGTGHLDTAWTITKKMGISLDQAFIDDNKSIDDIIPKNNSNLNTEAALTEIINIIISKGKIKTITDIGGILYTIGQTVSTNGYKEEGATIIEIATDTLNNNGGGEGFE